MEEVTDLSVSLLNASHAAARLGKGVKEVQEKIDALEKEYDDRFYAFLTAQAKMAGRISTLEQGSSLTEEKVRDICREFLIGKPDHVASYEGYIMMESKGDMSRGLLLIEEAKLQAGWSGYVRVESATVQEFQDMLDARALISPYLFYDDPSGPVKEGIYVRQDGVGMVLLATPEQYEDKANGLIALLVRIHEPSSNIEWFESEKPDPVGEPRVVNIRPVVGLKADVGSINNINNGNNEYPNGWFTKSTEAKLFVDTDEPDLMISDVELLMHVPSDRKQYVSIVDSKGHKQVLIDRRAGDESYRRYYGMPDGAEPFKADNEILGLLFEGNTEEGNTWSGVYTVKIETVSPVTDQTRLSYHEIDGKPYHLIRHKEEVWYTREESIYPKEYASRQTIDLWIRRDILSEYIDIVLPPSKSPVFRVPEPKTRGHELMKNPDFQSQLMFDADGFSSGKRSASFETKAQYDELSKNPDIGIAKYVGREPLSLNDMHHDRKHFITLVADTISTIRSEGKLVIMAKHVVKPSYFSNVLAHGSDVLLDLGAPSSRTNQVGWPVFMWMNRIGEKVQNCVWQGGNITGMRRSGFERVLCGAPCWPSDIIEGYEYKNGPVYDLASHGCGMQAVQASNFDADIMQAVAHADKYDDPRPPHGTISHTGMFATGVVGLITPEAQKLSGVGEQAFDDKCARFDISHCYLSGMIQNHVGQNSSWGDACGSHYDADEFNIRDSVLHAQRTVDMGSGANNKINGNLFLPNIDGYNILKKAGKVDPKGNGRMYHVNSYREPNYSFGRKPALETMTMIEGNVFIGKKDLRGHYTERNNVIVPSDVRLSGFQREVEGEKMSLVTGVKDPNAKHWSTS